MNSLVKLIQKNDIYNKNKYNLDDNENKRINLMKQNLRKGISKETLEKIKKAKEPTWIPITSWSGCSKLCDGGKSYLQRICIVPKNSKDHCVGDRIIIKECNIYPCDGKENILNLNENKFERSNKTMPDSGNNKYKNSVSKMPEIKLSTLSKSPNKYKRCVIKEGDLSLFINEGYLKGTKIPVRVILNKSTLTVFSSDVKIKN
jgi:hypothetical protein